MINILGTKRIALLVGLILVNALLAAAIYGLLTPMSQKLEKEVRTVKGQVSATRQEANTLRTEYQTIQEQISLFRNLEKAAFFDAQDRKQARENFEALQKFTNVLTASYDIQPAKLESTATLKQASHVLLHSPVSVTVEALDDVDVFNFIHMLGNAFPGHVGFQRIVLERKNELNEAVIRQIGSGLPIVMVRGSMMFEWRSLVPESELGSTQLQTSGM